MGTRTHAELDPGRPALPAPLATLRRAMRRRQAAIELHAALPLVAAAAWVGGQVGGPFTAFACAACALGACLALSYRALVRDEIPRLLRRLHAAVPLFEDSLELTLGGHVAAKTPGRSGAGSATAGLQELQRARILERLRSTPLPDLRSPYPWRRIALGWGAGGLLVLLATNGPALWPSRRAAAAQGTAAAGASVMDGRLYITPPAYTRLPPEVVNTLDARVPAGSRIGFDLRLGSQAAAAALRFQDGGQLPLRHDRARWRAERTLAESTLYRVQVDAAATAPADALHRLDVIPDRAPDIVVHAPARSLNVLFAGQKTWDLEFEATDDYGLATADLSITLAQGSGENIRSSERTLRIAGRGDARHQIYRATLDLAALGVAVGDDLIVRLTVTDNHPDPANRSQSAGFILRWPAAEERAAEGMEGLAQNTLPAYFSSERQLIIDTEALLSEHAGLDARRYATRADDLGVQQKVLRLRYGQFLGEEFESGAEHAPAGRLASMQGHEALKDIPPEPDRSPPPPGTFGNVGSISSDFGHVHDKPEAATLLDPDTRRILKLALDEMWQAELHLRQAALDQALPDEYKALDYIKEVQQAERIYLARTGVQLPQVDLGRRLTGDREGLSDRTATLAAGDRGSPVQDLWRTVQQGGTPDWLPLAGWIRDHRREIPDALGLLAAADRAQRAPRCAACLKDFARLLWPLLPPSPGALAPRPEPDAAGDAYLKALAATSDAVPAP